MRCRAVSIMIKKEELELDLKLKIADTINDFFVDKIQNTKVQLNKNYYLQEISDLIQFRDEFIEKYKEFLK
jgi:hypothetical protein